MGKNPLPFAFFQVSTLRTMEPGAHERYPGFAPAGYALAAAFSLTIWLMYYIRNWTIWLDLQILYRTLKWMRRGKQVLNKLPAAQNVDLDGLPHSTPPGWDPGSPLWNEQT